MYVRLYSFGEFVVVFIRFYNLGIIVGCVVFFCIVYGGMVVFSGWV